MPRAQKNQQHRARHFLIFHNVEGQNECKPTPVRHQEASKPVKAKVLALKKEKKALTPAPLQKVAGDATMKSDKGGWDSL
jgi:hypothetical protein